MNLLRLIFDLFLMYMLYKLVFDFIIPIFTTTKQVKQKMNEMQQKMNEHQNNFQKNNSQPFSKTEEKKVDREDYIEYEEIKSTDK